MKESHLRSRGFSLVELMVAMAMFLVVSGTIFGLLITVLQRHRSETEFLESFQNARVAVDQLMREVHNGGYPPPNSYTAVPADPSTAPPDLRRRFALPFIGMVGGVPNQTCQVNVNCGIPDGFNLRMEMDLDPENPNCPSQVEQIDYRLVRDGNGVTSTLLRRVESKAGSLTFNAASCLPLAGTGNFVPFVENVVNDPANPADAVFTYVCDDGSATCTAENIRQVIIRLTVRSVRPDPKTGAFRQITLTGLAKRINPGS
jgi:prepilin-type N-terminal cleavage/methylation domain-containing protein